MSRKTFDETIRKKPAMSMMSWPSKKPGLGPWEMLAKRLARGIRIEPETSAPRDPVYEATSRALLGPLPPKDGKADG